MKTFKDFILESKQTPENLDESSRVEIDKKEYDSIAAKHTAAAKNNRTGKYANADYFYNDKEKNNGLNRGTVKQTYSHDVHGIPTIEDGGDKYYKFVKESTELAEISQNTLKATVVSAKKKSEMSRKFADTSDNIEDKEWHTNKANGFDRVGKKAQDRIKESTELEEAVYQVTHDGHSTGEGNYKIFPKGKTYTNLRTNYYGSANKTAKLLKDKGFVNVQVKKNGIAVTESNSKELDEVVSPFDWKKYTTQTSKPEGNSGVHKGTYGSDTHKAKGSGEPEEKRGRGRPKGDYGSYKIDKATRDDPEYKQQLSAKVRAAKAEGFKARDEFKHAMHQEIMKKQLAAAGLDPKDHEALISKKNPIKLK